VESFPPPRLHSRRRSFELVRLAFICMSGHLSQHPKRMHLGARWSYNSLDRSTGCLNKALNGMSLQNLKCMAEFLARPLGNRGGPVMEPDAPSNTAHAFGKRANHHPPSSSLRMSTDALPRRKTRFSSLTVWYPYHASTICLYATAERWPALLLMVLAAPPVSGGSPTGLSAFSSTFSLQH
jgi:hypothetical protein